MVQRLILVPTALELRHLALGDFFSSEGNDVVEICGFGMVAAAARTAQLLAIHQPCSVDLLGIAGGYDPTCIGQALVFDQVTCVGIGAGEEFAQNGETTSDAGDFLSAEAMGWHHFVDESTRIGDQLLLPRGTFPQTLEEPISEPATGKLGLLTVASTSASPRQADLRRNRYPDAIAEDMEGFSVAVACHLAQVPLRIIRGISNLAGDRDFKNWRVQESLHAVVRQLQEPG